MTQLMPFVGLQRCQLAESLARRGLLALIATTLLATTASAQQYRVDPVDQNARQIGARVKGWLGNPAEYAANKTSFAEYFQKYYFPDMTQNSAADLAGLGDARYNLFNRVLWATSNEELQRDLSNLTFAAMGKIATAEPPYHPAVRYNAILVIGMLDDQYAIEGQRPPKPMAKATSALTKIVDSATTSDRFPPPVILGALIGLERHAKFKEGMAPDAVAAMSAALLKLATYDKPIRDLDREVSAWFRLRAATALAQLGSVGQNNAVHDALLKLMTSLKSLDDRCAAAALVNKLSYEGAKIDGAATAEAILRLTRDVSTEEAQRAQDFDVNAPGSDFASTSSFGENAPYPRAQVLARLSDLRTGLTKLKPVVPQDAQQKFDAVLKAIEPARAAASNQGLVDFKVTAAVKTMAMAIDEVLGPAEEVDAEEEITIEAPPEAAPDPAAASPAPAENPAPAEAPPAEAQ